MADKSFFNVWGETNDPTLDWPDRTLLHEGDDREKAIEFAQDAAKLDTYDKVFCQEILTRVIYDSKGFQQ